jgi:hypothetical protein
MAAMLAAIAIWWSAPPVWADGPPPTPAPFETIPLPSGQGHSHLLAYSSLLVGAGLVGASFAFSNRANENTTSTCSRPIRMRSTASTTRPCGSTRSRAARSSAARC